ncbi:CorA family divalent cation transporter [Streptomyces kutzneri]|uniref:CorA family divalent cation transporter n=1 Tax=Streptomyces kutzneri TaxID=3051179 RepID=UPI0028D10ECC|nr:CorA family divalent cation transporter [Streptomyces sp. DSM 40907]
MGTDEIRVLAHVRRMECVVYEERSGRSETVECGADGEACRLVLKRLRGLGDGEFGWVRLVDPAEGELVQLAEQLGLHRLAVEDAVQAGQRPKRERFGDILAVALKTLWYVDEETAVETGESMPFVGPRYVLSVRHGPVHPAAEAARRLEADPSMLLFGPLSAPRAPCSTSSSTPTARPPRRCAPRGAGWRTASSRPLASITPRRSTP